MAKIVLYGMNLLDKAGTIVLASGEAAGFPKENAFDRHIVFPWTDSASAGDRFLRGDQGAGGTQAVDSLVVAAGHNLSGQTVNIQSSPDGSAWTTRGTIVPSSAAFRIKVAPGGGVPWTTRYTRFHTNAPASPPSAAEIFLALSWTAPFQVSVNGTDYGLEGNVHIFIGRSGRRWGSAASDPLWRARYRLRDLLQAERETLEQWYKDIKGGARPFFIEDADGVLRFARLQNTINFSPAHVYRHDITLDLIEQV